jgi:2-keto-4-pentenoate hydratase/2-oxohepta-3-ene-1,7-dioic acid hydratase in catechol pathway
MKRFLILVIAGGLLLAVGSSWYLSQPVMEGRLEPTLFDRVSVATVEEALTLARSRSGAVVLVTSANAGGVSGINLGRFGEQPFLDTLHAFSEIGEARLTVMASAAADISLDWQELGMPIATGAAHIAAGTNYHAHAEEVGMEEGPFLFPKLSAPTAWNSPVTAGGRLDFEVELCAVPLTDHTVNKPARLAYLLCGDYTDRWQLVRDIDLDGTLGVTGFPVAKGGATRFPLGALLVIPQREDFYRQIELRLYLNDQLRQRTGADKMIWSPGVILSNALADCATAYVTTTGTVQISNCEQIRARTLLLTGTPAGVLFDVGTIWNPWVYLRPGDVVTSFGTYLGYMRNVIAAP